MDFQWEPIALIIYSFWHDCILLQAMYPTLVTTLVDTHRTIGDMYSTDISHALNHELDSDPITTLQFVQGDAVSSIGTLSQKTEENNDTQTA